MLNYGQRDAFVDAALKELPANDQPAPETEAPKKDCAQMSDAEFRNELQRFNVNLNTPTT